MAAHTECLSDLLQPLLADIASCGDQTANKSVILLLKSLGNLVHVLRLGDSLEVVLENFCEVVCKFLSACPSLVSIS